MPRGNVNDLPADFKAAEHEDGGVYRAFLESTDQGVCTIEVVFENEKPIDYRFLEVSPAFERQSGLVGAVGRRIREFAPDLEEHWFERYGRVALTGETMRIEGEAAPLGRWFDINACRVGAPEQRRVAVLFTDITERKRVEAALRSTQEQFEAVLNQAPMGVYLVDGDLIIQQVNPVALPVFGDIPGGAVGRDFDEIIHILWDQEYADEVVRIFRHTLETGEAYVTPERAEYRVDRDIIEYYEWRLDRIPLPGGRHGVVCYFRDISALVKARKEIEQRREFARANEERHALLLKLSDALRWLADPAEIIAVASEIIGRYLDVGRAGYGEVDANNEWLVVERDWTDGVMASMAGRHRVADFGPASISAQRSDQAFIIDDASNDPRFADHRAAFEAIGLKASLLVPLVKEGRWIAGFYAQQSSPRRWTVDDENLIRDVVERTWAAVERARAEAALRESENRLRAMFDSVEQGYLEVEVEMSPDGRAVDWRYLALSPSFERLTGMKDVTGRLASEVAPDLEPEWAERYAQVVTTGEPMRFVQPAAALGRWFDVNLVNIGAAGSCRIAAVYDDVTERKRADLALRDSTDHQALLLAELQHRVRNILTMVRSVARRTADNCEDVDDYVRHLDGRLAALARVQTILTRDPGQGVDLYDMVRDELESQAASRDHYQIKGPRVELLAKAAEVLSLAIHELATNSIKYGALSKSSGTIQIRWAVEDRDGQAWLRWNWHEPLNSKFDRPSRTGFGTELIVRRVPYELRGTGHLSIGEEEVEARIDFPLTNELRKLKSVSTDRDIRQ